MRISQRTEKQSCTQSTRRSGKHSGKRTGRRSVIALVSCLTLLPFIAAAPAAHRSEEHTSELQSPA